MSDEEVALLQEQLAVAKQHLADLEEHNAKIAELQSKVAASDERERVARLPQLAGDPPPQSAAELAERRKAELERILGDPKSTHAQRHDAMHDLERAKRSADAEQRQVETFAAMGRSLDVQAMRAAAQAEAEAKRAAEDAERKAKADAVKWGHARLRKYIGG